MEARLLRAALVVAVTILSAGAGRPYVTVRSQHFLVSAPTQQLANEICQTAEQFRRDLAIEWLGRELPPWQELCPIRADVAPGLGAGGATSFVFRSGTPTEWRMNIQGSRERVLDSVLPHEITHTIFATHFGRPLPRWADEGACTTVEHESEKAKQDEFLVKFLTTDRGIPFNRMFAMKDYPPDILPLYSQGFSLARFFIEQGGKPKFVEYVGEGMRRNDWPATTQKYYGFNSLSDLQLTWVEWVRAGSPPLPGGRVPQTLLVASQAPPAAAAPPTNQVAALPAAATNRPIAPPRNTIASNTMANTQMATLNQTPAVRIPAGPPSSWQTVGSQNGRVFGQADQFASPPEIAASARPAGTMASQPADYSSARPVSEGWYAKRRDQAQATMGGSASSVAEQQSPAATVADDPIPPLPPQSVGTGRIDAQPLVPVNGKPAGQGQTADQRRVLLEWTRSADESSASRGEVTGVAANDRATLIR
jgi:hypothetical protein